MNCPVAERSSPSRVRYAAPKAGAPLTTAGRSAGRNIATGGSGGKTTAEGVPHSDDLPAIHRPFLVYLGTATGRLASSWAMLLFRGRPVHSNSIFVDGWPPSVPANGCLVPLSRQPRKRGLNSQRIADDKSWRYSSPASNQRFGKLTRQVQGEVFFSLTGPYHGCPRFPPDLPVPDLPRFARVSVIRRAFSGLPLDQFPRFLGNARELLSDRIRSW